MPILKIAVIGAGVAGLCSAKRAVDEGFNVTVYEQTEHIGGIWQYTEKTGKDQYGINIHTAMHQKLRTILPYQVMEYPDFPYPKDTMSYPPQTDVLNYLHSYANKFGLKKLIKFNHLITRVAPTEGEKWEIVVKNLPTNTLETGIFDAVFVCNGHYSEPRVPDIPGADEFKGKVLHSHDFRRAEVFRDANVLVIGDGISGRDLVDHLSKCASQVTFSQHKVSNESKEAREKRESLLPRETKLQDDVKQFTSTGVEFIDGSHQTFDAVIYATGYFYSYRFLSADCGIHVDNNFVQPLYKQVLNIEHPSMAFICIPSGMCNNYVSDLQVRFALGFISGAKKLPTKMEMLLDMRAQTQIHWNKGYPKKRTHFLGLEQRDYCNQLAETAEIENIPDIMLSIFNDNLETHKTQPFTFRKYKYIVIDGNKFDKTNCD